MPCKEYCESWRVLRTAKSILNHDEYCWELLWIAKIIVDCQEYCELWRILTLLITKNVVDCQDYRSSLIIWLALLHWIRGSPVEQFINIRMGDAQEKSGASVSLTPQVNLLKSFSYLTSVIIFLQQQDTFAHYYFSFIGWKSSSIFNTTLTQVEEVLKRIGTNTKVKSMWKWIMV